jgi:hypothetical protein
MGTSDFLVGEIAVPMKEERGYPLGSIEPRPL